MGRWLPPRLTHPMPDAPRLSEAVWEELLPRLLLFATRIHRHFGLSAGSDSPTPADLVQEALTRAFDGRRTQPADVDPYGFVCGIVRSLASDAARRQAPFATPALDPNEETGPPLTATSPSEPVPLALLLDVLRDCLRDAPDLLPLLDLLTRDPLLRPRHIADLMETTPTEVYRLSRRLRRHAERCIDASGGDPVPA